MSEHTTTITTMYSVVEAARRLSVSPSTIRNLIRRRALDARKSGTRLLIPAPSLAAYMAGLPRAVKEG